MINLHDHKEWDRANGTLSVSMYPKSDHKDRRLHVLLNGSNGNFCLDYTKDKFDSKIAKQRAWSSDTGFYIKIESNDTVVVSRWWDDYKEYLPYKKIAENPNIFYRALIKTNARINDNVVSFSKGLFINLRNCIQQPDNGQISLRSFMYLLAALKDNVETAQRVDKDKWHLKDYDTAWINKHDWEWLYNSFKEGTNDVQPLVDLVLRHTSNRLFQEAHREATRKEYQTALFGGTDRSYDSDISGGAFYTPTSLVRTIVQESLWSLDKAKPLTERSTLRILDPACGSAEFLREALRQLKIKNYSGNIKIIGWDISEIACEMSGFILNYEKNTEWGRNVDIEIVKRDSLEFNWATCGNFDLVLMNPPFRSYENLGERKSIVVDQLHGLIKRQPDMAAVFWKKAAEIIADNGVLGLVMPNSLIGAETYTKLRKHIKDNLGMDFTLVARLGSAGLFEKAMIIPAVLIGVKNLRSVTHTVLWTDHQQESVYTALRELRIYRTKDIPTPVDAKTYSIYNDEILLTKEKWAVKSYQVYKLYENLRNYDTVGKLFDVKRGADAGNNAAFVLTKGDWELLPRRERCYFRPCIMRESINNGQLNDKYYMFYPYGKYLINSETALRQKLHSYYKTKLQPNKNELRTRRNRREHWWTLNEHRPWQVDAKPKLVSSYFGKAGYFAYDQDGEYLVGQSFAWLPTKEEMHKDEYYFAYLALLHAPLIDRFLEMVSVNVAGGQFDLSKHYIDKMPLPDLTKLAKRDAEHHILLELTNIGKDIHKGNSINKVELNQIVANSYGLNLDYFA
jgi:hypothetical protein